MSDHVACEVRGSTALITLNRPDRMNALLPGMGEAYAALLRAADADPEVRAIVVTGAGRGFCSGADLSILAEGPSALHAYLDGQDADSLPTAALRIGTPVITAVNGACAGIGFVLAISADVRFAAPTATFSTTFSRLGLVAEYGIAWLLPRLVGVGPATELLLSGRTITADEAAALGLVNSIEEDVLAAALRYADELGATCSPSAMAAMKRQLLVAEAEGMTGAVETSLVEMRAAFQRPDLAEAISARLEKRPPAFPGWAG